MKQIEKEDIKLNKKKGTFFKEWEKKEIGLNEKDVKQKEKDDSKQNDKKK